MTDVFAEISIASQTLNYVDDQLSTALRAIEERLRERVSTRIEIATPNASKFDRIAFGKRQGRWTLQVEVEDRFVELLSASRECRAEALGGGHIRRLIDESAASIREQIAEREAASQQAAELLDLLGAKGNAQ